MKRLHVAVIMWTACVAGFANLKAASSALAASAELEVRLELLPAMECRGSQCTNGWGECFEMRPDAEGIVNLDTMPTVPCQLDWKVLSQCRPIMDKSDDERCQLSTESEICDLPNVRCSNTKVPSGLN